MLGSAKTIIIHIKILISRPEFTHAHFVRSVRRAGRIMHSTPAFQKRGSEFRATVWTSSSFASPDEKEFQLISFKKNVQIFPNTLSFQVANKMLFQFRTFFEKRWGFADIDGRFRRNARSLLSYISSSVTK